MFPRKSPLSCSVAASLVPSLDDVILDQLLLLPTIAQVLPELLEIHIYPVGLISTAAIFVPSLEEVMLVHDFELPTLVQVIPESLETIIFPPITAAARFVPSLEDVMLRQFLVPLPVRAVQVIP